MCDTVQDTYKDRIDKIEAKLYELEKMMQADADRGETKTDNLSLAGEIKTGAGELLGDIAPLIEKYKKQRDLLLAAAGEKIADHPFISVAAAFGAGLAIAALLEKNLSGDGSDRS